VAPCAMATSAISSSSVLTTMWSNSSLRRAASIA
jgi:hypothetical protein